MKMFSSGIDISNSNQKQGVEHKILYCCSMMNINFTFCTKLSTSNFTSKDSRINMPRSCCLLCYTYSFVSSNNALFIQMPCKTSEEILCFMLRKVSYDL